MPKRDYLKQMGRLGALLVLCALATAAAIAWRPSGARIFLGAGIICCAGVIAAMAAAHFKRKFDLEVEALSGHARSDR